jgi:hypothetical protein
MTITTGLGHANVVDALKRLLVGAHVTDQAARRPQRARA